MSGDEFARVDLGPAQRLFATTYQFGLGTPEDLLLKMERELIRLRAEPSSHDHAFNFFVTAEHLLDWLYPGDAGKAQRKAEREHPLLAAVSHLANGAKHFTHLAQHHRSIRTMSQPGLLRRVLHWSLGMRQPAPEAPLLIELDQPLEAGGAMMWEAAELASLVLEYWMNRVAVSPERRALLPLTRGLPPTGGER